MTLSRFTTADSSNNRQSSDNHKRKLDDYSDYSDYTVDLLHKMKKHDDQSSTKRSGEIPSPSYPDSTMLQIFVRMMSGCKTIVIHADINDTVEKLYKRIELKTKIPVKEQRVIYKGKQLQYEKTLSYYSMERDASVQLVGRMQSTEHPVAWQTVDDIMHIVSRMHRGEAVYGGTSGINEKLVSFFNMIPMKHDDSISNYFKIFSSSSVPGALVMLYASSLEANKKCAKAAIKLFLSSCATLPKFQQKNCLPVVLEFSRLLRKVCPDQKLYVTSRNTLGSVLDAVDIDRNGVLTFAQEIFPFFCELADHIVKELDQDSGPALADVAKFSSFWQCVKRSIQFQVTSFLPIALPLRNCILEAELEHIYRLFRVFVRVMEKRMSIVESCLSKKETVETISASWSQYLEVLKIIHSISQVYQGGKELLASMLNTRKPPFNALVLKFAKRGDDDHQWIYNYIEVTNFESRRHLAMLLFPDVKEDYDDMHEMLIDRSNLLAESYEYISSATPRDLHGGLFMEFKNEEATGPGVLREWFYLVCQEIFSPNNTLFLRSADDVRRFSPNPASKVDPLHPRFFKFAGRVIALALMHKVQVGVLFDRVFFLQLAGLEISLEDIKETDRVMYNSCKQILEMDPEFFDSNGGLGLTFVLETEELGKRESTKLGKDGEATAVNSKNRKEYVDLLIKHRFAIKNSDHVKNFSEGFQDILSDSAQLNPFLNPFFNRIYLEDLDWMLRGRENPISIDDWKAHTEYNGYKVTDSRIVWFWKILKSMTEGERRNILFFWTSSRFIPVEGFKELPSKLYIYKSYEANDRLPLSHTCFYRLCLPKYRTMATMERRLKLIAQDHVSTSFGTW